jgi:hypothetical protein
MHLAKTHRTLWAIGSIGVLLLGVALLPSLAVGAEKAPPVKIAVFDFELEDVSAASSLPGEAAADSSRLKDVTSKARRVLAESGRYCLVDVSKAGAEPVTEKSLRNYKGCAAGIALQLGADDGWGERSRFADQASGLGGSKLVVDCRMVCT